MTYGDIRRDYLETMLITEVPPTQQDVSSYYGLRGSRIYTSLSFVYECIIDQYH